MTQHKNVYVALASAQASMTKALKSVTNPHFKSKYADLAAIVDAVKPALNEHGLAFYHATQSNEFGQFVETILAHGESETFIRCAVPVILGKQDMQGYKSATTYAKRIGLESVTGTAPEDDDGNAAAASGPAQITPEQFVALRDMIEGTNTDGTKFLKHFAAQSLETFPPAKFNAAMAMLKKKGEQPVQEPEPKQSADLGGDKIPH